MSEQREEGLMLLGSDDLGQMLTTMMQPILNAMGTMIKNNTEAIDRMAAGMTMMSDRMEALEKQVRLNTPIDSRQERYLQSAMKDRARELLDKRGLADDKKAVKKLTAAIRKSVLARYGIGTVREIPKHEYNVAMGQISSWMDMLLIRDIAKEAREHAQGQGLADLPSKGLACGKQPALLDGAPSPAGTVGQPPYASVR